MRQAQAIYDAVLTFAQQEDAVRAVILNGSRANPDAPPDIFQDYDILCAVSDMEPLLRDRSWIERFGERIIMQTPDEMSPGEQPRDSFAFLMLFTDGVRIDLTLHPTVRIASMPLDRHHRILLDKDGIAGALYAADIADYTLEPPTAAQYAACCNEFWWVSTYVAKGLWRGQLPYARAMLEGPVRDALHSMLSWWIGIQSGFSADPGTCGKYFERHLPALMWERYRETCAAASPQDLWQALAAMGGMFREAAGDVAHAVGHSYPMQDDERVSAYLTRVQALPKDATDI
jgi:aminoglycoside 6-adenylyltransferase